MDKITDGDVDQDAKPEQVEYEPEKKDGAELDSQDIVLNQPRSTKDENESGCDGRLFRTNVRNPSGVEICVNQPTHTTVKNNSECVDPLLRPGVVVAQPGVVHNQDNNKRKKKKRKKNEYYDQDDGFVVGYVAGGGTHYSRDADDICCMACLIGCQDVCQDAVRCVCCRVCFTKLNGCECGSDDESGECCGESCSNCCCADCGCLDCGGCNCECSGLGECCAGVGACCGDVFGCLGECLGGCCVGILTGCFQ